MSAADQPRSETEVPGPEVFERIIPYPPSKFDGMIEYDGPTGEAAIGVVVPFDFGLDWEYWRYLPAGVALYFTRTPRVKRPVGISMAQEVGRPATAARATKALTAVHPAVVLHACSSASFVSGVEGERQLRQAMIDAGAPRAVTSASAMVEALTLVDAKRIAVASPYTKPLTQRLVQFLEDSGFDVVSANYLGLSENIAAVSRRTIAELVCATMHPAADAVFVSCTALRTFGILAEIEARVGVPVLTSNQVSLWAAVKAAGPEFLDPDHPGWVLGGGKPMAKSTELLIGAADRSAEEVA